MRINNKFLPYQKKYGMVFLYNRKVILSYLVYITKLCVYAMKNRKKHIKERRFLQQYLIIYKFNKVVRINVPTDNIEIILHPKD